MGGPKRFISSLLAKQKNLMTSFGVPTVPLRRTVEIDPEICGSRMGPERTSLQPRV